MKRQRDGAYSRHQNLRFTYHLVGRGWGEATISQGEQEVTIATSYLSDTLGDLTAAVVALLNGAEEQTVQWLGEPGEYRWHLTRDETTVRVRIVWIPEGERRKMSPCSQELFVASCALTRLGAQIRGALRQILAEYGTDGYLARWRTHPFPMDEYRQLVEATGG